MNNINKIDCNIINWAGEITTNETEVLKVIDFPLPNEAPPYQTKTINGKRITRAADLINRLEECRSNRKKCTIAQTVLASIITGLIAGAILGFVSGGVTAMTLASMACLLIVVLLMVYVLLIYDNSSEVNINNTREKLTENYHFVKNNRKKILENLPKKRSELEQLNVINRSEYSELKNPYEEKLNRENLDLYNRMEGFLKTERTRLNKNIDHNNSIIEAIDTLQEILNNERFQDLEKPSKE